MPNLELRKNAHHRSIFLLIPISIGSVLSFALFAHIGTQVPYKDLGTYNNNAKVIALGDRAHAMKLAQLREHCHAYLLAYLASIPSSVLSCLLIVHFLFQLRNRRNRTKKQSRCKKNLKNVLLIAVIIILFAAVGVEVFSIVNMLRLEWIGTPQKEIRNLLIKVQELHLNGTLALEKKYVCCGVVMKSGKLSQSTTCPFNYESCLAYYSLFCAVISCITKNVVKSKKYHDISIWWEGITEKLKEHCLLLNDTERIQLLENFQKGSWNRCRIALIIYAYLFSLSLLTITVLLIRVFFNSVTMHHHFTVNAIQKVRINNNNV